MGEEPDLEERQDKSGHPSEKPLHSYPRSSPTPYLSLSREERQHLYHFVARSTAHDQIFVYIKSATGPTFTSIFLRYQSTYPSINRSFCLSSCSSINLYASVFLTVLMADTANSSDVPRCVLDSLRKSLGSGSPLPGCTNTSVRAESRRLRAGYGSALITSR